MPIRINSVSINPNPVNAGNNFIISVDVEDVILQFLPLKGSDFKKILSSNGEQLQVINPEFINK